MEAFLFLLMAIAFFGMVFGSGGSKKNESKPPINDNDINKAWWKGYQAGYEARCNELKSKQ